MKHIFIYALLVWGIAIQPVYAQNKLTGSITDSRTQELLPGVNIYIPDLKTGTISQPDGTFEIINIPNGNFLFEVHLIGFKKEVYRISIYHDTTLNFVLEESVSELNDVVITGVSRTTELKKSPLIIQPVEMKTLRENSSTNLIDALKNVPGIDQITTGAGISKPTIRGLGYNRVISLYNGIRQEGQQWGDEHGLEIDQYAIERIEIIKGPGSLMYGSDGIAGVLHFMSPQAPPAGEVRTQLISNYQSNNNLIGYSLSHAGNKNGWQWEGRFSHKLASNYQNRYDGKVHNSGFKELNANGMVGIQKKWGYSHLHFSTFNTTLNMVEGERDSLDHFLYQKPDGQGGILEVSAGTDDLKGYATGFPHQEVNHLRVSSHNYILLNKGTLNLDIGYQNNKRKEFGEVLEPDAKELFFDLNTVNYNLKYNLQAIKGWETSVGINGMYQSNTNKGEEFLIPEYSFFDIGGFVFSQKTIRKLTLAGGLRVDSRSLQTTALYLDSLEHPMDEPNAHTETKFEALSRHYSSVSGSLGVSYQATQKSTVKFNVSRGFRAPNVAELTSNGRHEGSFRYEYGSAILNPEISHQIDLAYFLNTTHITFELTPFANFISNYIFSEKMAANNGGDSIPDPSDPAPAFQFTQGNATLLGAEVFLDIHPHPYDWLHIENTFSYVQAKQSNQPDSATYLPFIPAPKYRGEIKAIFDKVGKSMHHFYVKFGITHYFDQNNVFSAYGTETATSGYTLLNAGIGTQIKMNGKTDFLILYLSAENLTDLGYQSHLNRLKYAPTNPLTGRAGVFNMGRNFSLKMILNI